MRIENQRAKDILATRFAHRKTLIARMGKGSEGLKKARKGVANEGPSEGPSGVRLHY